jgi:transposase InsO family protein
MSTLSATVAAKKLTFAYIEVFYKRIRMHSASNYLSPDKFESLQQAA